MTDFIMLIRDLWLRILNLFTDVSIELGGIETNLFFVLFAFMAIAIIVSIYWGGARA